MSTQPPAKKNPPIVAIKQYVEARAENLRRAMEGTGLSAVRFLTLAYNQTLQNPTLLECSKESWFDALQKAATHGLLPDGIHAALVPYKQRVTFQPMYQGLVQRAYATKAVTKIWAEVVYSGEHFDVRLGDEPRLTHIPSPDRGDQSQLVACYACAKVNGEPHFVVLFPKDVARHMAASKTASRSDSPWATHKPEMWKKTAIIVLSKTLPHFTPEASRFAETVEEAESDGRPDAIDVAVIETPDPLEQAKDKLRAMAPQVSVHVEQPENPETLAAVATMAEAAKQAFFPGQREPGSDDGDPAAATQPPSHDCFHEPIHGRSVPQGKVVVCPSCKADVNAVQLRAAEGRYAAAQEGRK